jgi:hypothetical protein
MNPVLESDLQWSWQMAVSVAALAGLLSHHTVFRPYEIDGAAWELLFLYFASFGGLWAATVRVFGCDILAALLRTLLVATTYNVSLAASVLVYRAFFHRLRRFPGPFNARLSRFYAFHKAAKSMRGCEDVQKLHAQYGDFVRIGTVHGRGSQ